MIRAFVSSFSHVAGGLTRGITLKVIFVKTSPADLKGLLPGAACPGSVRERKHKLGLSDISHSSLDIIIKTGYIITEAIETFPGP